MIEWRKTSLNFVGIVDAIFLGKMKVGHVTQDFTYPKPSEDKYMFYCHLPGVQRYSVPYADAAAAQKALEKVVKDWIKQAGLKF